MNAKELRTRLAMDKVLQGTEKKELTPIGLFKLLLSHQHMSLVNVAINVYNTLKQEVLGRIVLTFFDTRPRHTDRQRGDIIGFIRLKHLGEGIHSTIIS